MQRLQTLKQSKKQKPVDAINKEIKDVRTDLNLHSSGINPLSGKFLDNFCQVDQFEDVNLQRQEQPHLRLDEGNKFQFKRPMTARIGNTTTLLPVNFTITM
eukprot:CAMPEP_0170549726 /NCGR_PEP_ID=MMETSP0211-20121228/7876_1 /TAXON_ID=311385 /ORGANISM="Pseudokeronopsis sp., Strain OXSARD2" /LENGTH=100 /DNA_ID=CAMNT_0010855917 /DNA_START=385 /DNA_END=684 /DNA_ORIENTATION=-